MDALALGYPTAITQNVVYALPASVVRIHSSAAVEISIDGSVWDALTNADTVGADASSIFLRCPGGNATVVCKRY